MTKEILKVRPITEDVAAVHLSASLSRPSGPPVPLPPNMSGARPLMILVRQGGVWKIAVFQNTPKFERPAAEAEGS